MSRIEHPTKRGFYLIPGTSMTYIEKHGICWDEKAEDYLQIYMSPLFPYPAVRPSELKTDILIHRCLGLVFLKCPGNPEDYQVDHLNMDKLDWRLSNLEWVSRSENNRRSKTKFWNRPLSVKDLVSEKVVEFKSIRACSRFFGTHPSEIAFFLQNNKAAPFQQRYDIIFAGHSWSTLTAADVGKVRRGVDREVVVRFLTGEKKTYIFKSVILAAKRFGLSRTTLHKYFMGRSKKSPIKDAEVMYLSEFTGVLSDAIRVNKEEQLFANQYKHKIRAIRVTDYRTEVVSRWKSLQDFADHIKIRKNSIMKSMQRNNGVYRFYKIVYEESPQLETAE